MSLFCQKYVVSTRLEHIILQKMASAFLQATAPHSSALFLVKTIISKKNEIMIVKE